MKWSNDQRQLALASRRQKEMAMHRLSNVRRSVTRSVRVVAISAVMLIAPSHFFVSMSQNSLAIANDSKAGGRLLPRRGTVEFQTGVATGDNVRVVVRSYETAAIGAEINARITHLPQREGDRFLKGDVIVAFDCSKIIAEHSAATAIFKAHQAIHDNQRQMLLYNAVGTLAVEQARFEMEKAMADVSGLEARRASCTIHAPSMVASPRRRPRFTKLLNPINLSSGSSTRASSSWC